MNAKKQGGERWTELLRVARRDEAPSIDEARLMASVVREAQQRASETWVDDFCALFSRRYVLGSCWLASLALCAAACVQAMELLDALPWAQLVLGLIGGAP